MPKSKGYIKLYRDVREHWLWQDSEPFTKRGAWIDMLMRANHAEQKVVINNEVVPIQRGQFLCSERNLADDFQWSRTKLRNFFKLLESDTMIKLNKDHGKTIVTICNYDTWQGSQNQEKTREKPQKDQARTTGEPQKDRNNNIKNVKNVEEEREKPPRETALKKIHEHVRGRPFRNFKANERKYIAELDVDFGVEVVNEAWRYFLKHVKRYTESNGSVSVAWFHQQFNEVIDDMVPEEKPLDLSQFHTEEEVAQMLKDGKITQEMADQHNADKQRYIELHGH